MHDNRDTAATPGAGQSPEGRLDSWKEIAAYLGRGIRTVQRWEREEGLPVHRIAHEKRGTVYASRVELAAWWESRRLTLAVHPAAETNTTPFASCLERVTRTSAATLWPSLSSDGRMIVYVSDAGQDNMAPQIWLQQIGGAAMRLTTALRDYSSLSFSADDTRIIFTAWDDTSQNVYEVPTLGGEPRLLKRAAGSARPSPDGHWLAFVSLDSPGGVQIAAWEGVGSRTIAPELADVTCAAWSPDSRALLVYAHLGPSAEPDWWIVPVDGRSPSNTGVVLKLREEGFTGLGIAAAWVYDSLVFSAAARDGVSLWRQRIVPSTFQVTGDRERLTSGNEFSWFPTAAGGRLAFVNSHPDANLWSVAVDVTSGVAHGPLRRMTRGPGILGHLSVASDGRTLAYFSSRLGNGDVFLRDLDTGSETLVAEGPATGKGFPAISPSGKQLAYATRVPGVRAMRPIFVGCLADGTSRTLGDDCGGRPRQWVDEHRLVIERFGPRLNSIALIDTTTGEQRELLVSTERSLKNPRVSPDGLWIAFDAANPGESPRVLVASLGASSPIPESTWVVVDRSASHPFWSVDGRLLYYLPTATNAAIRSVVRARHFARSTGLPEGEPITGYALNEMAIPTFLSGTTPIATSDRIIFVLGDFRGDIWFMELEPHSHRTTC